MATDKGGLEKKKKIKYTVIFHPKFKNDLQKAYDYYEEKRVNLGEDFLLSIEEALAWIEEHPLSFQKIYGNKRKVNTRRFPYGIIYFVKGTIIYVTIAIPLYRNPAIWKKRSF